MIKNVLIILPTYNESENIGTMLKALKTMIASEAGRHYDVLVVDDNSPDGTQKIVKKLLVTNTNINLLKGKKEGLGKAYLRGFEWGMKKDRYDAFIMMDADFSHDPKKVPELVTALDEGSDYVIGSRYVHGGHIPGNWPIRRIFTSKFANFLGHFLTDIDQSVADITGGFKALRVSALSKIDLNNIHATGYFFMVNLVYEFIEAGFEVSEKPISFNDRELGESKLRFMDVLEFIYRAYVINPNSTVRKFVRFGLVGLCGTLINLAVLTASIKSGHIAPAIADIMAIEISIITNFLLNNRYTFKQNSHDTFRTMLKKLTQFNAGTAAGAAIQFVIFLSLLKILGTGYVISDLAAIAISFLWNYWMSTRFVWRTVDAVN